MKHTENSQDTGYFLVSQLIDEVEELFGPIDRNKLEARLSAILSLYDIAPKKPEAGHPDIIEKMKSFLSAKKIEGFSPHTLSGYGIELRIFAENMPKPTNEIDTNDIRMYLSKFPHLKPASIAKKLFVLKSFFGWREHCKTPRERAFIEVFYATGGRLTEVYQLNKEDVDWQNLSIRVLGKGSKEREVYLSTRAAYHLRKYLNSRSDNCTALFVTERKPYRRLSRRGIQREIKVIAARAGIEKNVHPHVLRHTFATLMLNNGAELAVLQQLLGHESPVTTQIYAQVTDARKKETHRKYLIQ